MRIPSQVKTCRYYVATSNTKAFSSWDTLEEAIDCVRRFSGMERNRIVGIMKVTPSGKQRLNIEGKIAKN